MDTKLFLVLDLRLSSYYSRLSLPVLPEDFLYLLKHDIIFSVYPLLKNMTQSCQITIAGV